MKPETRTLKNLKKVLKELPILAEKQPFIKTEFDMRYFGVYSDYRKCDILENKCGTIGCLAGNMARVFKLKKEYFDVFGEFTYDKFFLEEFPSFDKDGLGWDFLFSGIWRDHQPTFEQAMKRLEFAIKFKLDLPPWEYQKEDFCVEDYLKIDGRWIKNEKH